MTQKRPVGRPKKDGAKKAGQLNPGECYFTFIGNKKQVQYLRQENLKRNISMKELMERVIDLYERTNKKNSVQQKNEQLLKQYQNKSKSAT